MSFRLPRFFYVDNVPITPGTGTSIATDDILGIQYQRTKLVWGVDGVATDASTTNPLPVVLPSGGFVSVVNSTAANLGIGGVFTGTGEDVTAYASIKVSVFSSALSAVDGLQIQQSTNNTDWDGLDIYSIPAATNRAFSVPVNAKFFRVVYTNGATATTAFRLQVIFHTADKQPSSVRPQDGRSNDNDFVEILSFLMGYNSTANAWNRVGITSGNLGGNETLLDRLKVNASLRMIDTAQPVGSQLVGATGTQALGLNVNVGTDITTPTAMPAGGLGVRGWLSSIWTKLNGIISVAGTRSNAGTAVAAGATHLTVGGSDGTNLRQLLTDITGKLNVIGTFFQATQPVSNAGTFAVQAAAILAAETTKVIGTVNLAAAQTLAAVTAITNALPTGANKIGTVDIATAPATTKGTQGVNFLPTQDAKDAGRNATHYYMVVPILSPAAEALQSLTVTKGGVTVLAATTPAVVTAGKILRITRLAATYIATATSGYGIVKLRFNTAGLVAVTSPIAVVLVVGSGAPTTANSTAAEEAAVSEGWEFAAGTGIGITTQGFAAVTGTLVGYLLVSVTGYEY